MRAASVVGFGFVLAMFGAGCANRATVGPTIAKAPDTQAASSSSSDVAIAATDGPRNPATSSTWIGASAEGEMLLASTRDTFLGVWVDVPESRPSARPPMDVALVIDTSGSMAGAKIENARNAASTLVKNLKDGDIVSLDSFSDNAKTLVPPTRLDSRSRQQILEAIARLTPTGSTNMFDGLTMGESQVAQAPATHSVRRVVVISDGIANVGPSSPETLGAIAQRGLRFQAQVTSLGVGNDYDERTLDALAVNSSGRLYHLSEPKEMATILKGELDLLDQTLASNAFVEVVPAPGVQLSGADGVRADFSGDGSLRIPLGALHSGQHREALVRVRLVDPEAFTGNSHPLASVRLRFKDTTDGGLERVQEVVARTQLTNDENQVASTANSRTKAIVAIQETAKAQVQAAQRINDGDFASADKDLARAEASLQAQASVVKGAAEKKRLEEAQRRVASVRAATQAAPSAPKAAQRKMSLEMNASGMHDAGF
jgi:Ca-activated chloride channel family protein